MKKPLIALLVLIVFIISGCSTKNVSTSTTSFSTDASIFSDAASSTVSEGENTVFETPEYDTEASTNKEPDVSPTPNPEKLIAKTASPVQPDTVAANKESDVSPSPNPEKPIAETIPPDQPNTEAAESQEMQTAATLEKKQLITNENGTLNYWLYRPNGATKNMPLIIYLHGGSGKGDDLDIIMGNSGFPQYLKEGQFGDIPAYVAIPQVPSSKKGWMDIINEVKELVLYIGKTYQTDKGRIALTGHSMGGTGTYALACAFPELFTRIAPLRSSIKNTRENIAALSKMPIWSFVGSEDTIVKPDASIEFIAELSKQNSYAKNTVITGADHFEIPSAVYLSGDYDLIDWLIE